MDVVHAQGGPELHSPLVRPRRQQLDDVDPLVEERPGAVGHPAHVLQSLGLRPLGYVGAVDLAEPGGVGEGLVAAAHRVGEHLDAGAGDLLDVAAGLLRGERRLEGYVGRRVAVGIEDQSGAVRGFLGVGGVAHSNAPFRSASANGLPSTVESYGTSAAQGRPPGTRLRGFCGGVERVHARRCRSRQGRSNRASRHPQGGLGNGWRVLTRALRTPTTEPLGRAQSLRGGTGNRRSLGSFSLRAGEPPAGAGAAFDSSKQAYTKFKPVVLPRSTLSWLPGVHLSGNPGCLHPRNQHSFGVYNANPESRHKRPRFFSPPRLSHSTRWQANCEPF